MRLLSLACLVATIAALRLTPIRSLQRSTIRSPQHSPISRPQQRSRKLVAQLGWVTAVDEASGQTYYYNEATGETQWEPPLDQYAQQDQYGGANQEVITYISERLQEPQVRIVRAVVDFLGTEVAYELLDQTEQIQSQGGMIVPDTGRPRTPGGVYLTLLKQASHLPRDAQEAALRRIKEEGKGVKSWEKGYAPSGY